MSLVGRSRRIRGCSRTSRRITFGKWALFYDEEFVGTYDTDREAVGTAIEKFGRGPYLIRQIGVKPVPPLASVIYR